MMEQLPENNAGQGDSSAAIPVTSLGRTLREARERLGLSVADMAGQIKFATRQIEALEADDFQHLPEAAFLRGFVRSYAKILQLDAQTLLAALPQTKAASVELMPASVGVPFPDAHSLLRQNLIWSGAALLLAVIAVGFALWNFTTPRSSSEITRAQSEQARVETPLSLPAEMQIIPATLVPETGKIALSVPAVPGVQASLEAAESPAPAAETPASKAAPQTQSTKSATRRSTSPQVTELRLVFGEESWTEIKDRDGKILSSQINPSGSELIVYGRAPFSMLIGHGLSVRLYHQGKQVDLTPYINKYSEVAHVTLE